MIMLFIIQSTCALFMKMLLEESKRIIPNFAKNGRTVTLAKHQRNGCHIVLQHYAKKSKTCIHNIVR